MYKLIESDNPILKVPLSGVSEDCDRQKLQDELIETMKNFKGLGLSANQVGLMERVFVMYTNFEKREATACFNPKITYYGEQEVFMDEGCLSYPGLWLKVKRPYNIFVNYENGEIINYAKVAKGFYSRPAVADGKIYIIDKDMRVLVFN